MSIHILAKKLAAYIVQLKKSSHVYTIQSEQMIRALAEQSASDLNKFEHKTYSQYGEDGIIEEIFSRIGTTNKVFLEIGSGDGLENNTLNLLIQGWKGYWIESDPSHLKTYQELYADVIASGTLKICNEFVKSGTVATLFQSLDVPKEIDLFSLDIDGNDYYVWRALEQFSPRVAVIEYNAVHSPRSTFLQQESVSVWNGGNFYGTSLLKLNELATKKSYTLVTCNLTGNNAFFVRSDLVGNHFPNAGNVTSLYQKARYYLTYYAGSYPSMGPWVK